MKTINHRCKAAFSLVEVTIAIGVAGFSLISILGLLPVGLSSAQNATAQTGAMNVIGAIAADIRITPPGATASPRFKINPTGTTTLYFNQAGIPSASAQAQSTYEAVIQEVQPTPAISGTMEHITVGWPAQAPGSSFTGSVEVMVSLPQD